MARSMRELYEAIKNDVSRNESTEQKETPFDKDESQDPSTAVPGVPGQQVSNMHNQPKQSVGL